MAYRSTAWMEDASCNPLSAEAFFPSAYQFADAIAVRVCGVCPVAVACREYEEQFSVRQLGVWAGHTPGQRNSYKKTKTR